MIKSNLSVLLAERGLKITQVAHDTGISRTTLTSLYYRTAQGVQFETIDKICQYLKITPGDLFAYAPYSFEIVVTFGNLYTIETGTPVFVEIHVTHNRRVETFNLSGTATAIVGHDDEDSANDEIEEIAFDLDHHNSEDTDCDLAAKTIEDIVSRLPKPLQTELDFSISDELQQEIESSLCISTAKQMRYEVSLPWTSISIF